MAGIDFMAIARGRQLARKENRQDRIWAQEELKRELERETWQDELRDIQYNREAMAYVAPLITHLQTAQAAGINPVDYLLQQRDQIMADPAFQRFAPEVQNRVLQTLGQSMRVTAQDLQRTGRFDDAQRLTEGFNVVSPVTGIDQARAAGSPQQAVDFLNAQYGTDYAIDESGMVNVHGTMVPADQFAAAVFQADGQGAAGLAAAIQQRQVDEQRDREVAELRMLGYNPDGTRIVEPTAAQRMGTQASPNPLQNIVSEPNPYMSTPTDSNWRATLSQQLHQRQTSEGSPIVTPTVPPETGYPSVVPQGLPPAGTPTPIPASAVPGYREPKPASPLANLLGLITSPAVPYSY